MAIGVTPPLTLSRYRDLSDEVFVLPLRSRNDIAIDHQGSLEPRASVQGRTGSLYGL